MMDREEMLRLLSNLYSQVEEGKLDLDSITGIGSYRTTITLLNPNAPAPTPFSPGNGVITSTFPSHTHSVITVSDNTNTVATGRDLLNNEFNKE